MIAAAIVGYLVLGAVLVLVLVMHGWERREWVAERRALVDRAIAQHTGEVLALDRSNSGKQREPREPVVVEGLN